jgi:hypothetical protein
MPESSHAPELHAAQKRHLEVRSPKGDGDYAAEPRLAHPHCMQVFLQCGEYAKDCVAVVLKVRESRGQKFPKGLSFPRLASRVENSS